MKGNIQCKLCKNFFSKNELTEEHYPAKSVGNEDIISFDIKKFIDKMYKNESSKHPFYDDEISKSVYPNGRTSRCLCRKCNSFLGNYDEAYLKFYNVDGNPEKVKGFSKLTKLKIIKAIYGKFISIPETSNEEFDFIDFINDKDIEEYLGKWSVWFIKRDSSCDLLNLSDIGTGKATFEEGIVYEFSDEKFIFNLINFEKHSELVMTNIFDILNKKYQIVTGCGSHGSYHESILGARLFSNLFSDFA